MIRAVFWAALVMAAYAAPAEANVAKASDWIDMVVVTSDGELLGRVEDFAIDTADVDVEFIVVAVGSFLIDDNLIAVAPDALELSADGEFLIVYSDGLASARRFGPQSWPGAADVLASAERAAPPTGVEVPAGQEGAGFDDEGVATISDGRRTAVIRSGERSISVDLDDATARTPAAPQSPGVELAGEPDPTKLPLPRFETLDRNGDGALDRREIGARLARTERYADLDTDQSGTIDRFEYDLFVESRR